MIPWGLFTTGNSSLPTEESAVTRGGEIQKLKKNNNIIIVCETSQLFIKDESFFPAGLKTVTAEYKVAYCKNILVKAIMYV